MCIYAGGVSGNAQHSNLLPAAHLCYKRTCGHEANHSESSGGGGGGGANWEQTTKATRTKHAALQWMRYRNTEARTLHPSALERERAEKAIMKATPLLLPSDALPPPPPAVPAPACDTTPR